MTRTIAFQPTTTGSLPEVVSAEEALAFADAADDRNPLYAAGTCVPPAFGHVLSGRAAYALYRMMFDEWPDVAMIHLASDAHFYEPITPGMHVVSRAWTLGMRPSPRGAMFSHGCSLARRDGALLLENFTTLLLPEYRDVPAWGIGPPDARSSSVRFTPVAHRAVTIADDQPARYARMSGDQQSIHLSDAAAQAFGLPRRTLHGACTMGICAGAVVDMIAAASRAASRVSRCGSGVRSTPATSS